MTTSDDSSVPDFATLFRQDGRGFIVVGAGQGIGRQVAHGLTQLGAQVLCVDIDAARAEEVAKEIDGVACAADAREREDVERVLAIALESFGKVDGIVDIIGMARWSALLDTSDDDWEWTFGINLRHAFLLMQLGGRVMAQTGGGSMTFCASLSSQDAALLHGAFGAAKAGLLSLVRTASVELGPSGIRVNAINPGPINTPRMGPVIAEVDIARNIPTGRIGEPWDMAAGILFLASDCARQVNGQAIAIDGGGKNGKLDGLATSQKYLELTRGSW